MSEKPKTSIKATLKALEKHKLILARERDALRELQEDIEALADVASDACDNLEYAIDRLSELV